MLRVAVIGVGAMGKHHARVYHELPNTMLVAVSDVNVQIGKEITEKYPCAFYSDYREMLSSESIDALSIAVPTNLHKEIGLECIKKGKHILVEKPITDTLNDAETLITAANNKKIKLMVGHIERFNSSVIKLKELIEQGELGTLTTLMARRVGVFPPQVPHANIIIDSAIHDIDIFNYFLNKKPNAVVSFGGNALTNNRIDYADILLKYNGTNAFIQVNWITPVKIRNLTVTGTEGYAELNYITQDLVIYKTQSRKSDTFNDVVQFGIPEKIIIPVKKEEPLRREISSFIECIEGNKEPPVSGEEALESLRVSLKVVSTLDRVRGQDATDE